ncbi:DUF1697 domain-containing protein [Hutsoniella sourekii]
MEYVAMLRGVTPTGKNRIPKMTYLVEILEGVGLKKVRTYIQSGNIILETERSKKDLKNLIHDTIKEKIGADLSVIIKTKSQLERSALENPFDEANDFSRIHLVFTNDRIDKGKLRIVKNKDFGAEKLVVGKECLYLYLPRDAKPKKLNTNYLERQLSATMTMRKLNVINHLVELCK